MRLRLRHVGADAVVSRYKRTNLVYIFLALAIRSFVVYHFAMCNMLPLLVIDWLSCALVNPEGMTLLDINYF